MRIIKVNLTDHTIREEAFHQEDYGFFGGRGLIARFLTGYCDPLCDALGPDNPLIFATGYFSGTILTTSNRLSIGAKSPLTGGIKESNSGGTFARRMTDHQIKIILFEGQSPDWVYLYIDKEGNPSLVDAAAYMGMNTYPVGQAFRKTYNDRIAIAAIGTAGEHLGLVSSIMVTEMNSGLRGRPGAQRRGAVHAVPPPACRGREHLRPCQPGGLHQLPRLLPPGPGRPGGGPGRHGRGDGEQAAESCGN